LLPPPDKAGSPLSQEGANACAHYWPHDGARAYRRFVLV